MADDLIGVTITDRYRIISQLGVGGMGVAYRAWDSAAGVPVVIKMPKRAFLDDPRFAERFAREIRVLQGLAHPHIVPILDMGEHENLPFVVMRFLPGGSLSNRRLRDETGRPKANPAGMLTLWLRDVASALDHIHAHGIVHRDVKPGNIFFDAFWSPFLGDFGIAKIVEESEAFDREHTLTATGMVTGTPDYMAPEQFTPTAVIDGRADQYALAVVVYEVLSGGRPFTGKSAHLLVEVMTQPAPRLDGRIRTLPSTMVEAVHRGLDKRADQRFPSCVDFADAILSDVPPLSDDPGIARLLCPQCTSILKLPTSAAGQEGKCPKCRTKMKVANDLGALWLLDEARKQRQDFAASVEFDAGNKGSDARSRSLDEDTARMSALNVNTDLGLKKCSPRQQTLTAYLRPLHIAVGGSAVGALLLISMLVVLLQDRSGRNGELGGASAKHSPSLLDGPAPVPEITPPPHIDRPSDDLVHEFSDVQLALDHVPGAALGTATDATQPPPAREQPAPLVSNTAPVAAEPAKPMAVDTPAGDDENKPAGDEPMGAEVQDTLAAGDATERTNADQIRQLLADLVTQRAAIHDEVAAVNAVVRPLQIRSEHLRQEIIAGEQSLKQKTQAIMKLQRVQGNAQFTAEKGMQLALLANDVNILRQTLQPIVAEQSDLLKQISTHAIAFERCVTKLNSAYPRWQAILSQPSRHYDVKLASLTEAASSHSDLPEVSLWLAWLQWHGGDHTAASAAMTTVAHLMSSPNTIVPAAFPADFVLVSLLVEEREVAGKRLALFKRLFPKHARIPYLEALDNQNKERWSTVKMKMLDAFTKEGAERDIGLNSDAALFFACAPTPALRDTQRATECIERVATQMPEGTFNSLRARAAVSAEAGKWDDAVKLLIQAEAVCPRPFLGEITAQKKCYANKEIYVLGR